MNPLLESHQLPPFSRILPEHIEPALDHILDENRHLIANLLKQTHFTWENLMNPLEDLDDRLHRMWSQVEHLHGVMDSDDLREAYNACLPKLTAYSTELSQNEQFYLAVKSIKETPDFADLDYAQRKTIDNALRDFHLSGVDLPADKKAKFATLQQALSQACTKFSENVLDANQAWTYHTDDADELAGLPEHAMQMAQQIAQAKNKGTYCFTLDFPCYLAVMQHAEKRELRQMLYEAYVTRASDQGPNANHFDNSGLMLEILRIRKQLADLLGFENYAECSLATKMADNPQQVLDFLYDLAKRSKPLAEKEIAELKAFAKDNYGADDLQAWDMAFYSEKLRQKQYAISDEQLRPYFPEQHVLENMFEVVNKIYGLKIFEVKGIDAWHKDVRFFEVRDDEDELRGYFYTDLYVRENKRGGAWMDQCQNRRLLDDVVEPPVAFLNCNFSQPVGDNPALLTHMEVTTLYHEFGHCLHHLLTKINYPEVGGINGVAWDAVELPSQFMENFCWQKEILDNLPEDLFERLVAAKNFQSGMQMLRQLEFSLFDFLLHQQFDEAFTTDDVQALLDNVRAEISVVPKVDYNRFQHSFCHIFAGGYGAGYYSYKWAEVLSSDAFAKFEEEGLFNRETGLQFLHHILEQGGSRDMQELYQAFRGRLATVDALLRHSGI